MCVFVFVCVSAREREGESNRINVFFCSKVISSFETNFPIKISVGGDRRLARADRSDKNMEKEGKSEADGLARKSFFFKVVQMHPVFKTSVWVRL